MNLDLNQFLQQGPVRDLLLNQVTKQLGVTNETGGNLITKGLSILLGGMTQKASTNEGANSLFDLIKNTNIEGNPLEVITDNPTISTNNNINLIELGKNILPSLFGDRTDTITDHLANTTNTSPATAKGILGMLLPVVFSFFKNKIANGLGLNGFTNLLGEQARLFSSNLDSSSLAFLGFANKPMTDTVNNVATAARINPTAATAGAAAASATTASRAAPKVEPVPQKEKSSGLAKWLIAAGVILAALFGIKSCSDKTEPTTATPPPVETAPAKPEPTAEASASVKAEPAAEVVKTTDGLGNFAWTKTDKDLTVSGTVQNEKTKTSILDAFKGLAAGLPLVDKLVVDAKAEQFSFTNFSDLANLFKDFPNVSGAFADKIFNLMGSVASADEKTTLVDKAKALLGNMFTVNADKVTVNEPEAEVIADMSLSKLNLDIMFATGSSEINPRYHRRLNALAQYLAENKRYGEIAGYTDNVGDAAANQKLSEERANAIRDYLIKQGMPADALTAVGYGQENPIADNSTEEGRTKNRRIEFNVR